MKNIFHKLLAIILSCSIICALSTGCSYIEGTNVKNKINIVCTVFPQYDWVMNLIGDRTDEFNVTLLVRNGVDIHSYQPSARDIVTIATCDLFIYVGGESDSWVKDVLKQADNPSMKVINMMDVLGDNLHLEEEIEGMEHHSHHEHSDDDSHCHDCSEHTTAEYDEHIWLSLKNASIISTHISKTLSNLDEHYNDNYEKTLASYLNRLQDLDEQFANIVSNSSSKTVLFGDRFPFMYLAKDYDLQYYAAFPGCSAETEASFETIIFLSDKMKEHSLNAICVTESSDCSIAKTIIENSQISDADIIIFNSMQSVGLEDIKNGTDYISIMKDNLASLKKALED